MIVFITLCCLCHTPYVLLSRITSTRDSRYPRDYIYTHVTIYQVHVTTNTLQSVPSVRGARAPKYACE